MPGLVLFPPTTTFASGESSPIESPLETFPRLERSPTIPRIGRAIAAILPDFLVKPDCHKRRDCSEEDKMDRLTEMEAFATVVDQGGFTDAAKKMGI